MTRLAGFYPILTDALVAPEDFADVAADLADLGVTVMQLRFKTLADRDAAEVQRLVADRLRAWPGLLVVNDRADLAELLWRHVRDAGEHAASVGLHLGQTDLPPRAARAMLSDEIVIGVSTHDPDQLASALSEPPRIVDHVAFGPVFATRTKADPDPVVGLEGLAAAAELAHAHGRRLVAIGGIGVAEAGAVRGRGADAVAVIHGLFGAAAGPDAAAADEHQRPAVRRRAAAYLQALGVRP